MLEFVFGTDTQYDELKTTLEDGLCHVYKNCDYPKGCSPEVGRIGFEKENDLNGYALFIDKGVEYSNSHAPVLFREWLSTGTLRFIDFTDLKEFLRSLQCLF